MIGDPSGPRTFPWVFVLEGREPRSKRGHGAEVGRTSSPTTVSEFRHLDPKENSEDSLDKAVE